MNTRICEVVVNNEYQGIYILTEKIKQDKNRVNISTLASADTSGIDVTGGYIIKIDYDDGTGSDGWQGNYPAIDRTSSRPYYIYSYPKPDEILDKQKLYIQSYIKGIDSVLRSSGWKDPINGYRKYLNVAAFNDYFIIGEVSRNVDTYKKSAFFYKDRIDKDGRLQPGPVWDLDWAWKNINECMVDGIDGSGWTYLISSVCRSHPVPPGWIVKLLDDTSFANEPRTRYNQIRKTILSEEYFNHYIDSVSTLVSEAQVRHYQKWPILGKNVGTPEVDEQPQTYEGEIEKFKNWISIRIHWLDSNMPGKDLLGLDTPVTTLLPNSFILYQNYPNPFNSTTKLSFVIGHLPTGQAGSSFVTLKIYDVLGSEIATLVNEEKPGGEYEIEFDATDLTSGIYLYKLQTENYTFIKKMIYLK